MTDNFYVFEHASIQPNAYQDWTTAIETYSKYVREQEPTTLTYTFGVPLEHADDLSATTKVFAFEAYTNREAYEKTHHDSREFRNFTSTFSSKLTRAPEVSFHRLLGGFLASPPLTHQTKKEEEEEEEAKEEASHIVHVRITCPSASSRAIFSQKFAELARRVEEEKTGEEEGVLTFMAFESLTDEVGCRIFARFRSEEMMGRFVGCELVEGFWEEVGALVERREREVYVPARKGFLQR